MATAAAGYPQNRAASPYGLTADQQEILDTATGVARDVFAPLARRMDDEEYWPPETMPELARMGFLGVTVSPDYGGAGSDLFGLVAQRQQAQLARALGDLGWLTGVHGAQAYCLDCPVAAGAARIPVNASWLARLAAALGVG